MQVYVVCGYRYCGGDCEDYRIYNVYNVPEAAEQRIDELNDMFNGNCDWDSDYSFFYQTFEVENT